MPLKYISIYKYKYIYRLDIKLQIVHTYRILATQTINMFYHMYILLYYLNSKRTFTIILLLVKINKIILGFPLY